MVAESCADNIRLKKALNGGSTAGNSINSGDNEGAEEGSRPLLRSHLITVDHQLRLAVDEDTAVREMPREARPGPPAACTMRLRSSNTTPLVAKSAIRPLFSPSLARCHPFNPTVFCVLLLQIIIIEK